jgi:N-acetylglutamate synthase-like GNAT family acetyltransferase
MIEIRKANEEDIPTITKLAEEIWWPTYTDVVSAEQIAFMLGEMYSAKALKNQMENEHSFFILTADKTAKGFAAFSKQDEQTYKLQKLYLHPDQQGNGTGKTLISFVEKEVTKLGAKQLILNVNRGNKAHLFYTKVGYKILEELDIPYHHFILDDYIMGKNLV